MALEARKVGYSPTLFGYTDTSLLAGRDELGADDLGSYESVLPGYDSGHGAKPEPDGLLACAAAYGAGPDQLVMVGDTATDMEAAARAGCTSVLLAPHGQPVGGPDHVVSTLAEVGLLFGGRPGSAQA
jgi:phosphoglycolate phosphatase-like HAD superfamily hydrolase